MASSWRIRKRSFRPKGIQSPDDYYRLDLKKSSIENAYEIYSALCASDTSESKRLSLLNAFAALFEQSSQEDMGFTTEELLFCISASLVHAFAQVRAAALRAMRHLLRTPKDIQIFNSLQLPQLVCRSIDILLQNEEERVQALKLVRKTLALSPELTSPVIVRCLVALCESGVEDGDRMLRACLATLCEFGVLNPTLFILCGGVSAITRNVLECHSPRIAESLCGVLLHLLEWPQTRNIAGVRLDCLAAPYCDFTYRLGIMDKNKDARELRYTCSRLALLSVLRSWAGTIEFCDPHKPSGLKAIVDVLYLNQLEVRKAILDLLYELLGLPQPIWTDEYSVALSAVDPSDFQDAWRLNDGFVALEGRCILPSLASRVPNICEQHLALLLYCFLETGLINALVEVIVSSDTFLSVRATVLVGKLLQLMHTHLPADICSISPALPTLITYATQGNPQAHAAISALQSLHQMLQNRPASCSLFLDNIIQSGALINSRTFRREISSQENFNILPPLLGTLERRRHDSFSSSHSGGEDSSTSQSQSMKRSSLRSRRRLKLLHFFDSLKEIERLIKDSNVLLNKDGNTWDWEIIIAIFRSDVIGKLDDMKCRFIRRLVLYFKPSSNCFSHQDLSHGRHIPAFVTAGLELIDWLLQNPELEYMRLLTDLFADINSQLFAISSSRSAHDCLFSPEHMRSTMCQQYFLFIGRMCRYDKGISILTNTAVFRQLENLVISTNHVCYVKLIVSGLEYGHSVYARRILEKALVSSKIRDGRLYATQFMLVLLRARIPNFEVWGLPMLINQTKDTERCVVLAALEILDEACHERTYLEEIVSIWPDFKPLGDMGNLLMARYYSIPRGLNHQKAEIVDEIEQWKREYNKRYVLLVEADTHASLTLHTKNEDGFYSRRNCSTRPIMIPPNIPPHLYGQLIQTEQGTKKLKKHGDLPQLISILTAAKCSDETESLELKSALWALGHISTNSDGVEFLNDPISRVYEKIIALTKCDVYSVRATALNVLGLVGSTNAGANVLYKLDWYCVRHDRNTLWPVCQPEDWLTNNPTPVRHQYEEVPPYNYTGIDENINGFNTSSDSNSFYFDENGDSKDSSKDEYDGQIGNNSRSRTPPEAITRFIRHVRSLSESKTTDVISLINSGGHHRQRFNSGTDSNTSGVSSCESVFGRNIIAEVQQTQLSPIPSTSNLLELPLKSRRRRITLASSEFRIQGKLSPQDMQGYATLRSLRKHSRPVLSESAADELAEIFDNDIETPQLRPRKLTISESQRKIKVRSLDRHSTQIFARIDEFHVPLPTLTTPKFLKQTDSKGPCYSGICLPKNILDLFPLRNLGRTYVSHNLQEYIDMKVNILTAKCQLLLNDLLNEGDEGSVSSLSDVSSASKRTKGIGKHNRLSCLNCCRSLRLANRLYSRTDSDINIFKKKSTVGNHSSSVQQLSDISFNSPESILSDESIPDRLTTNILHHVQRMANPVCSKQSKLALLELKQKHPSSFQDVCLYSEVCRALGRGTYRMNARRFLQELFLDLHFDSFSIEPCEIISSKRKETSSCNNASLVITEGSSMTYNNVATDSSDQYYLPIPSPVINNVKTQKLASVYETSFENLSNSLDMISTTNVKINSFKNRIDTNNSGSDSVDGEPNSKHENNVEKRRRFRTADSLDLSCTVNKFPITRRCTPPSSVLTDGYCFNVPDLSKSVSTPTGSLFCEKRLQSSKSEAVLSKTKQN